MNKPGKHRQKESTRRLPTLASHPPTPNREKENAFARAGAPPPDPGRWW
jgi:hypothetical protein